MNRDLFKQVLKILGAHWAQMPEWVYERIRPFLHLTRHYKCFRIPNGGLVIWLELWCDSQSGLPYQHDEILEAVARGFRGRYLKTQFSLRWIGMRRPLILTPIESSIDLARLEQALEQAKFRGDPGPNEKE